MPLHSLVFTGSRQGMTPKQLRAVNNFLKDWINVEQNNELQFHHGDCLGADNQFHWILTDLGYNSAIYVHPGNIESLRAYCQGKVVYEAKPPLVRNRDMVHVGDFVLGTPRKGSRGTWHTLDYGKLRKVPTIYFNENGRRFTHYGVQ